jgi:Putative DNA-binding domain
MSARPRRGWAAPRSYVVAFANGAGGTIYVGAGPADRKVVPGVPDAAAVVAGLVAEIEREISPRVEVTTEVVAYSGKSVIALQVAEGKEKPHALAPASILVRHGAETRVASRDEIVAMVRGIAVTPVAREAEGQSPLALPAVAQPARPAQATPSRTSRQPTQTTSRPVATPRQVAAAEEPPEIVELLNGNLDPIAPRTGAEIVEVAERDGVPVYAIRDLRNGLVTPNVTRDAARRLWKYAIQEREEREVDEGHVRWRGDFGFWKVYRPSRSERRFNLVYREAGTFRVFYGVTEEGLDERWRAVIPAGKVVAPE